MRHIVLLLMLLAGATCANAAMDWSNLKRERIELVAPLLIIKGESGLLACGYINAETCDKMGEACAIVNGVSNHDEMLKSTISAVSDAALALGVEVGMSGLEAIELMR
ncbi:MAG TPA: DUF1805 domain-containing protein [Porticoccaceae bacterium]|nr:YunC family protein [Porticoccaceae bacterium]HIG67206.1 DUF1805 domain-containing protein [Porticoccaceae bacterium]HIK79381.1 DUF1805 domain-containing protein [Porticoccaceae bacterium]